ncbi:hypothetical protein [Exiguobacterium sp. s130]|uniref:hypothetical protein n=1 Tax=Exiguobacterium sp. s130 TaxID=2751190 RepID=UPI001BEBAAD0|nr:hypothetical protein [Exiguobacterium sp. s130]
MDLKRYEPITGREALGKLLEGKRVYFKAQDEVQHYEISDNQLLVTTSPSGYSYATVQSFLKEVDTNWYVKKPFDVRAEMLARPNEWVGAFRDSKNVWHKIGLDSKYMVAVETRFEEIKPNWNDDRCDMATLGELKKCIPFEDVPEEELT